MNYEVVALPVPKNPADAEGLEKYLEKASAQGIELVSAITLPANPSTMMCVFRAAKKGELDRSGSVSY